MSDDKRVWVKVDETALSKNAAALVARCKAAYAARKEADSALAAYIADTLRKAGKIGPGDAVVTSMRFGLAFSVVKPEADKPKRKGNMVTI